MRFLLAILVFMLSAGAAGAEGKDARIALVIGNNTYSGGLLPLKNAINDAILISATLRMAGFEVEELHDADIGQTDAAIERFAERIRKHGKSTVGLFYFAGHGLQSNGANYLVSTDAPVGKPDDVARFGTRADTVLRLMATAGAETNILILDACRPNRVSKLLRPLADAGLAELDARDKDPERGFLIAYSTGLGETAADGADSNSPYARTLADQMLVPRVPIEILFRNVRKAMVANGFQKPWESTAMQRGIAFVGEPLEPAAWDHDPLAPGKLVQIGDFGSYPADLGFENYIPAERYLRQGRVPIRISGVSPPSSEVVLFGINRLYEGQAVIPSLSGNVLTQIETGNGPASFTLELPQSASKVRFLIPKLFAATQSGVTFPAWKATAYASDGRELDTAEDELVRSFTEVPEKFFVLSGSAADGIVRVKFESDPRLGGVPFAAFSALLIEGIWVEAK